MPATGRRIRPSGYSTGRSGTHARRWEWYAGSPWRAWIRPPVGGVGQRDCGSCSAELWPRAEVAPGCSGPRGRAHRGSGWPRGAEFQAEFFGGTYDGFDGLGGGGLNRRGRAAAGGQRVRVPPYGLAEHTARGPVGVQQRGAKTARIREPGDRRVAVPGDGVFDL